MLVVKWHWAFNVQREKHIETLQVYSACLLVYNAFVTVLYVVVFRKQMLHLHNNYSIISDFLVGLPAWAPKNKTDMAEQGRMEGRKGYRIQPFVDHLAPLLKWPTLES